MSKQQNTWLLKNELIAMDYDDERDDDAYEEDAYDLADLGEYHPVSGRWN